ncbi:hypothetical protein [Lysinibacillus telephonicus]|uniref:DUF2262 domain-containing protein n=1 Tax=Lysinibacillus telephonicus TaxID=1714840 RepID=A0A3S0KBN8_9BACI|nr:hypothetical protein [Lysinibacillus telephonicus]RTQ87377.1 hypothetical protein EKG35_19145 [Lysinibacillus telephonicus]
MINFEDILHKRLVLSRPLSKNEAEKLNLTNTYFGDEEENSLPKQWFCSIDIEDWKDVEIFVQGNMEKPNEKFIEMAGKILDNFQQHLSRALKYLKEFFPTQEVENYDLSAISFGKLINFDDYLFKGFTIAFIYGDYPYAFQFKVKFKENGWPIGFEGGPL